jgi:hypothetical protein
MTVSDVEAEVLLLNLENIKKMPIPRSLLEDFYNMWQRFGPQAARTYMIPPIWNEEIVRPSEYFNV